MNITRSHSSDAAKVEVTVSNRTIFRIVAGVILAIVFFAAVVHSAHTLTLIGAALFLSLALNGPVRWLS